MYWEYFLQLGFRKRTLGRHLATLWFQRHVLGIFLATWFQKKNPGLRTVLILFSLDLTRNLAALLGGMFELANGSKKMYSWTVGVVFWNPSTTLGMLGLDRLVAVQGFVVDAINDKESPSLTLSANLNMVKDSWLLPLAAVSLSEHGSQSVGSWDLVF